MFSLYVLSIFQNKLDLSRLDLSLTVIYVNWQWCSISFLFERKDKNRWSMEKFLLQFKESESQGHNSYLAREGLISLFSCKERFINYFLVLFVDSLGQMSVRENSRLLVERWWFIATTHSRAGNAYIYIYIKFCLKNIYIYILQAKFFNKIILYKRILLAEWDTMLETTRIFKVKIALSCRRWPLPQYVKFHQPTRRSVRSIPCCHSSVNVPNPFQSSYDHGLPGTFSTIQPNRSTDRVFPRRDG